MNAKNRDSCRQLFKNLKILPLKSQSLTSQYFFPFYYWLPEMEIYMNQIQEFLILTPDLILTYILQLLTLQLSKKVSFILESKFLITFLLASQYIS